MGNRTYYGKSRNGTLQEKESGEYTYNAANQLLEARIYDGKKHTTLTLSLIHIWPGRALDSIRFWWEPATGQSFTGKCRKREKALPGSIPWIIMQKIFWRRRAGF